MHRPTASAEGVSINVTNEYLVRCMLDNSETVSSQRKAVCQQNSGLKNMLAYPTSGLAYAILPTSTHTHSLSPWMYALDRAHRVVSQKLCLRDGE